MSIQNSSISSVFSQASLSGWIKIFGISLLLTSCGHDSSKNRTKVLGAITSDNNFIVGTWQNDECTKVEFDSDYEGTQSLWYHETLTITENTFDSVNTYFIDAGCTRLDSYQPTSTKGGLLSYRLGSSIAKNVRKIDLTARGQSETLYTVVSVENNQLKFGEPNNISEDGKSDRARLTKIDSRAFLRINTPKR